MPIYEYKCKECETVFEVLVRDTVKRELVCPKCGQSNAEKIISSPAVHFKGTGWGSRMTASDGCNPASVSGGGMVDKARPDQTVLHGKESTVKKLKKLL